MKHFTKCLKFLLLALCVVGGVGSAWGQASVGMTLWAETWTGATTATSGSDSATPSANYGKGTTVYNSGTVTYAQSANTVYVRNDTYAEGTAPELMLSSGKTWTISDIPTGGASELTLVYKSNNTKSSVTCSTSGASIAGSSKSYTITTGGAETITLVFGCSSNTRIDDVLLTVKTSGVSKTNVGTFKDIDEQAVPKGGSIDFDFAEYYTDDSGVTGTTTVTVTPTSGDIYYSGGKIYATAYGSQEFTITATPAAADEASYQEISTTFTVTCADNRTAVNMTSFSATETTLVKGNTTTTSVTNDQNGWTAAYTYSSSDEDVATVDDDGVITAVAKGEATITCSLNIDEDDASYKVGTTASMTVNITVNNPSHTASFSVNGAIDSNDNCVVEEGESISFPEDPDDVYGKTFIGWVTETIDGTSDDEPTFVTSATMSTSDITYYAVFAAEEVSTGNLKYTLDYNGDGETLSSKTLGYGTAVNYTAKDGGEWVVKAYKNAGMQINKSKNSSIKVPVCSGNIQSIEITGGTAKAVGFSSNDYTGSETITYLAEGTDATSQTLDLSAKSVTTGYIVPKSGSIAITKIVVNYRGDVITYSDYCTTVVAPSSVATPTFTVAGGTYTEAQSVEIECETDGVTIYYTTNGDNPTTSSYVYSEAIEVSANTTIKAIAVKNEEQSNVASATYNIKVAVPTFSSVGGTYDNNQSVEISTATAGATIYYTTDGSTPTTSSSVYSSAITVDANKTLKAIAVKDGMTNSDVSEAEYVFKVAAPTFSVDKGNYPTTQTVELSTATEGATIRYTTNGAAPGALNDGTKTYTEPISVSADMTIMAIAVKDGFSDSDMSEAAYFIVLDNTPGTGYFEKVTDASSLAAGDNILLVNETVNKAMSTTQNTNNRDIVSVTIDKSSAPYFISSISADIQRLLLQGTSEGWYFYTGSGYLYAASSSSNWLRTEEKKDDNAKATISISDGDATITFKVNNTNRYLRYNSTSGIFSCYGSSSSQDPVQIYKEMPKLPVTIGSALYTTFCPAKAVEFDASVTAYVASAVNGEWITLTEVSSVPAGTPVIVGAAASGTYTAALTESASAPASNLLSVSDGTVTGGSDIYALAKKDGVVGFYVVDESVTIPAGKCYLQVDSEAKARLLFSFGEDASGIQTVSEGTMNDGILYNLSGQRVNAGYKGIVIKNGKKYLNK